MHSTNNRSPNCEDFLLMPPSQLENIQVYLRMRPANENEAKEEMMFENGSNLKWIVEN